MCSKILKIRRPVTFLYTNLTSCLIYLLIKIDWSSSPYIVSRKSSVRHANEIYSTQRYCAPKGQHLTFPTHYQPYSQHTPSGLDLLAKWPHGSKITKSRNSNFPTFPWHPSKFRFTQNILAAPTILSLHVHKRWAIHFWSHYQPYAHDT